MAWYDDLNEQQFLKAGPSAHSSYMKRRQLEQLAAAQQATTQPAPQKGNMATSLLPTAGGVGGALAGAAGGAALGSVVPIVGTAVGGLLGAILGGAGGSALGKVGENAAIGEQDLSKGVAQEALFGGLTSTPIGAGVKLARAGVKAGTGFGSRAAGDLVQEAGMQTIGRGTVNRLSTSGKLDEGATNAVGRLESTASTGGIRGKLADTLGKGSDTLAIKGLNLAPAQDLGKFKTKFGEDIAGVVKRNNLVGKNADEFDPVIQSLNDSFSSVVSSVPAISKKNLGERLTKVYQPLLDSPVLSKQAVGKQLKEQSDAILKSQGETISAADLNKLRQAFDSEVNYTSLVANPERYSVNKRAADTIRNTIRSEADKAGIAVDGKSLKEIGSEVSKLRFIQDAAAKRENNGRGSGPLGLRNLLGAGVGGGAGGIPGAVAGMATTAVANNPKVLRASAGALDSAANKLGADVAPVPKSVGQGALGLGARQGLGRMLTAPEQAPQPMGLEDALAGGQPMDMGMGEMSSLDAPTNAFGISKEEVAQGMVAALQSGNTKAFDDLKTIYTLIQDQEESGVGGGKALGVESQKILNNAGSGLQSLNDLESMIDADPSVVMKASAPDISGLNGVLGTSQYRATIKNVQDTMSRLRSGASMTEQESARFDQMLPRLGDSPEVIKYKISQFRTYFEGAMGNAQSGSAPSMAAATVY